MRCKHCNARLATHDIWCVECGRQTSLPRKELSALNCLSQTWTSFSKVKSQTVPIAGAAVILGVIPIALITWLFQSFIQLPTETGMQVIASLLIKSLAYALFLPFILSPLGSVIDDKTKRDIQSYFLSLKRYPKLFLFSLIVCLMYALFYVICFGLPKFGSDPILRLVWLVLLNYWAAIFMPAWVLMYIKDVSPFRSISLSYKHFHDVRWNIYLMILILAILNSLAAGLALVGLLITLPFSWFALSEYTRLLVDFELLEYRR